MAGVKGQVQQRGVERRRAMVDAAITLFSQQGVRGTGVAAIAERAGVTPSALIHHFGSKDGLVRAVLEEADRRALARLSATPASEPTLDEAFDWFVRDAEHTAATERELTALHTTLTAENLEPGSPLHTWFRDRGRALRAHLTALFTRRRPTARPARTWTRPSWRPRWPPSSKAPTCSGSWTPPRPTSRPSTAATSRAWPPACAPEPGPCQTCVGANIRSTAGRTTTEGPGVARDAARSVARDSGVVRTPGTPKDSARAT